MNDQVYVMIILEVLKAFKSECEKYACCLTTCKLYNKNEGTCFLRECPCDYDLNAIEKAVSKIIHEEKEGEKNDL